MGPSPNMPQKTTPSRDRVEFSKLPVSEPEPETTTTTTPPPPPPPSPHTIPDCTTTTTTSSPSSAQYKLTTTTGDNEPILSSTTTECSVQVMTSDKKKPSPHSSMLSLSKVAFIFIITTVVLVVLSAMIAVAVVLFLEGMSESEGNNTSTATFETSGFNYTMSPSSLVEATTTTATTTTTAATEATTTTIRTTATTMKTTTTIETILTFPFPKCQQGEFQCSNGQCLPQSSICDKSFDCPDMSDEVNCSGCFGFECATTKVCLWDRFRKCNGKLECRDLSDEMDCPISPRHRLCDNGVRVPVTAWCNGLDDCRDNSDEKDCACRKRYHVPCQGTRGRCIYTSWVCDGYPDCLNGTDEMGCDTCDEADFQCSDYSCIPGKDRCDGKIDCPNNGEDELGCFNTNEDTGLVTLLSNGSWVPICSDRWTGDESNLFCHSQHKGMVESWKISPFVASHYATLDSGSTKINPGTFRVSSRCKTGKVVHIRCKPLSCGQRQLPILENAIAGGDLAPLGKWPWIASLAHLNSPICGAVIIDERWLLTAFHCVMRHYSENSSDPSNPPYHFTINYGTITSTITPNTDNAINGDGNNKNNKPETPSSSIHSNDNEKDQQSLVRHVVRIYHHPKATLLPSGAVDWDIALLKVDRPIVFSDTVQPICLPAADQVFTSTTVCYLAGWGKLSEAQVLRPSKLRDTRLQVWPESRCKSNTERGESQVNTNSTVCAGYFFGQPSGCKGDSGGPLMCLDQPISSTPNSAPRWSLAGVLSRTNSQCGKYQAGAPANRFGRISTSVPWILETIAGG